MDQISGISKVDIQIANNTWWVDAFQFGFVDDQTWNFTGKTFLLDVKYRTGDVAVLLGCSTGGGQIVTTDAVQRILSMQVTDAVIRATLPPGCYHYDLIMVTTATGQRDGLMYGELTVVQGVTIED